MVCLFLLESFNLHDVKISFLDFKVFLFWQSSIKLLVLLKFIVF